MALKETPTDSYGMPLLILDPHPSTSRQKNKHHLWHPDVELSTDSDADRALRYSIVQKLSKAAHKYYHRSYGGPKLPDTDSAKFFLTILGRSGYIAEEAISLYGDAERVVLNRQNMKGFIVFPDYARKGTDGQDYKTRRTGIFLAHYAISQDLGHMECAIDEFLHTRDTARKLTLGNEIIDEGVRVAVDPYVSLFAQAMREHRIRSSVGGPFEVVRGVFRQDHNEQYIETLESNLRAA